MSDCYYVVTTPVPLNQVDTECKNAYGTQASIFGFAHNASLENRMDVYLTLEKLVNIDR